MRYLPLSHHGFSSLSSILDDTHPSSRGTPQELELCLAPPQFFFFFPVKATGLKPKTCPPRLTSREATYAGQHSLSTSQGPMDSSQVPEHQYSSSSFRALSLIKRVANNRFGVDTEIDSVCGCMARLSTAKIIFAAALYWMSHIISSTASAPHSLQDWHAPSELTRFVFAETCTRRAGPYSTVSANPTSLYFQL